MVTRSYRVFVCSVMERGIGMVLWVMGPVERPSTAMIWIDWDNASSPITDWQAKIDKVPLTPIHETIQGGRKLSPGEVVLRVRSQSLVEGCAKGWD